MKKVFVLALLLLSTRAFAGGANAYNCSVETDNDLVVQGGSVYSATMTISLDAVLKLNGFKFPCQAVTDGGNNFACPVEGQILKVIVDPANNTCVIIN